MVKRLLKRFDEVQYKNPCIYPLFCLPSIETETPTKPNNGDNNDVEIDEKVELEKKIETKDPSPSPTTNIKTSQGGWIFIEVKKKFLDTKTLKSEMGKLLNSRGQFEKFMKEDTAENITDGQNTAPKITHITNTAENIILKSYKKYIIKAKKTCGIKTKNPTTEDGEKKSEDKTEAGEKTEAEENNEDDKMNSKALDFHPPTGATGATPSLEDYPLYANSMTFHYFKGIKNIGECYNILKKEKEKEEKKEKKEEEEEEEKKEKKEEEEEEEKKEKKEGEKEEEGKKKTLRKSLAHRAVRKVGKWFSAKKKVNREEKEEEEEEEYTSTLPVMTEEENKEDEEKIYYKATIYQTEKSPGVASLFKMVVTFGLHEIFKEANVNDILECFKDIQDKNDVEHERVGLADTKIKLILQLKLIISCSCKNINGKKWPYCSKC